jgi:phage terminase Nu1 subunit (DNA packaging protein)
MSDKSKTTTDQYLTQRAFAKVRAVTEKTVSVWKSRGLLVMTAEGLVAVAASNAILDSRAEVYRGGAASAPSDKAEPFKVEGAAPETLVAAASTWSISEALRRKEIANALTRQLQYDRAAGELVPAADIKSAWARIVLAVRSAMLNVPARMLLAAPGLTHAQLIVISKEINAGLHRAAMGETLEPDDPARAPPASHSSNG